MPHDLKLKKLRLAFFNSTCTSTEKKTLVSFESKKKSEVNLNRKIQHFTVYPREQGGNLLCLAKYPAQLGQPKMKSDFQKIPTLTITYKCMKKNPIKEQCT